MKNGIFAAVALLSLVLPLRSAPLLQSTFTDVVKDVTVIAGATKATAPAKVKDDFKAPDLVRTGADSRAELTAPDQTVTRVGANTVFSFEPAARNLRLEQGSVLFHSPAGKGGGNIRSGGASAAVLGTTLVVVATPGGGFKVIVLEGKGKATLPNGKSRSLKAGQMVYVLAGGTAFSPVLDINLARLVAGSQLVNGFSHDLSSLPLIDAAIEKQRKALAKGQLEDTGVTADAFAAAWRLRNGLDALDQNSYSTAAHPALTRAQLTQLIRGQKGTPTQGSLGGAGVVAITR